MVDHALILWALPGRFRRRISIAMNGEILREWLSPPKETGWLKRLRLRIQYLLVTLFFNVFSMPQHAGFRQSFAFAGGMIERGYGVLVFPEGRRSPDGRLQTFKSGIGLLATQLGVPVVPIRIDGLHEVRETGRRRAPAGAIAITIGRPVACSIQDEPEAVAKDLRDLVSSI